MAVDRGYGSGKPRSAANSAARRVAADKAASRKKNIKKQASNPGVRLGVSRVGKTENAGFNIGGRQYLETGINPNKLLTAAKSLFNSGQIDKALAVESRLAARIEGRRMTGNVNDVRMRNQSTPVFPRIDSTKIRTAPNRILEEQGRRRAQVRSYGRAASKEIARNASTPKMSQQQAQDSYERVSDLVRFGRKRAK